MAKSRNQKGLGQEGEQHDVLKSSAEKEESAGRAAEPSEQNSVHQVFVVELTRQKPFESL